MVLAPIFLVFPERNHFVKIFSRVTQRYYEPTECVFIGNMKQAGLYIKHGAQIYDVLWSRDDKLIFVFKRADTQELYYLWNKRELTWKELVKYGRKDCGKKEYEEGKY